MLNLLRRLFPGRRPPQQISPTRPRCVNCGEELVFVALVIPGGERMWRTWQCDCYYRDGVYVPEEIVADIVRARDWDDGSVVVKLPGSGTC
jgi:hypothetical protein